MVAMTDPAAPTSAPPTTDPIPGDRRLAHPPSDRYRTPTPEAPTRPVSPGRGISYATIVGVVGAVAIVVLGGVLTLTGGLFAVAAVIGYATALALRVGAGSTIGERRRAYLALGLALVSVALGQLGLWLYALTEGGVLPLVDYLGEVFGPLVPIQAVIAGLVAWVTAR
jgi:hypothetical protein